MFPGNQGGGADVAIFVTPTPAPNGVITTFTLPNGESYVPGTITAFVSSVLVANGDLTETSPTSITLPNTIIPNVNSPVRLIYEIL